MANTTPVARVSAIQGQAFAKGKDGQLRALRLGDPVFEGDVVVTADGSRVDLASSDGRTLIVRANETLSVDAEVAGSVQPDAADSSIKVAGADVNKIIKAINQGGSLDELLEETASDNGAGSADGGPSFVRLMRIAENVDPLNFEFNTARPSEVDEFVSGGGDIQDSVLAAGIVAADVVFAVSGQTTVNERGLTSLADSSETSTGTITVTAPGGLSSLTVGGVAFTSAQLSALAATPQTIITGVGTLTLTGFNAASGALTYTYTLDAAQNQPGASESVDSIALSVTGTEGSATGTLTIQIVDSVPLAVVDSNVITEDDLSNTVSGSVLTNDAVGADANATPVTATAGTINLTYGSLLLNNDGSYIYTLNNAHPAVNALKTGQSLTDRYTYTLTDGDGDTTTAQLVITIDGNTDGPPSIVPVDGNGGATGQATVNEQGLSSAGDASETTTGTITVSAPDGLQSVVIGGATFTAAQLASPAYLAANTINTGIGTLTLTSYDPLSGALSYTYTLNGPVNQPGATSSNDPIALTVNDLGGDSNTGTLTINILDTAPLAIADVNAISEDATPNSAGGNVIITGAGSDTLGADATTVTGVAHGTPASASGNVGSGVNGAYGTLVLSADGSYTYTLNNANPAVNALKTGQSLTETYTYTITDADGDASTATLTITINGNTDAVPSIVPVDGNGGAAGQATVNEQGLSSAGDASETTTGTITVSAPDGLQSVVIGGVTFTAAQLASPAYLAANTINTVTGTLTLTGYDPLSGALSYTYTLNGPIDQPGVTATTDPIALTVNDLGGDSNTGTLTINILDTAPLAIADVNAITEDTAPNPVSGNVITTGAGSDTLGADATAVTGVAAGTPASASGNVGGAGVAGSYGTLILNANGSYTYTLNNANPAVQALNAGETTTDIFTYTLTDADGDASSTTLTVTLTGSNDLVTITIPDVNAEAGDLSVREDQTTTGSFTISTPDGLDPVAAVTIAGTAISKAALEGSGTSNVTITTPQGVLTVTGYDPLTGVVSYSYDPSGTAKNHTGGDVLDAIPIVVRDDSGDTSSSTLTINILDTAPLAIADVNAITEDTAPNPVSGNVITTGAGSDTLGADATAVTGVAAGTPASASGNVGGAGVAGSYGTLILNANGSYTYTLNNANPAVQALNAGETTTDIFTYTLTDADGDASSTTLTVTLTGSNDLVTITIPDVNAEAGDLSVREDQTTTGSFTISTPDGLDPVAAVTIAGTAISKAALEGSGTSNVTITTPQGVLTVTGYDPLTGVVSYSYDPSGTAKNHTGGDVLDAIPIVVRDDSGDTSSSTLTINILDTAPLAIADVNAITEDTAPNPVSGNVITTGAGSDTLGADATAVTGVAAGTPASASGNVGGAGVAGSYGTLILNANGSYTYTLNNANPAVQALNAGETTTDIFTYTLTDADGDASSTTLTVTLTGSNDLVTITIPDVNAEAGDLSVREDQTTTGSFTISTPDGLDPVAAVTIAGTAISKAALEGSGTTNVTITTPQGVLTVTGYDPLTGIVSYSYDPSGTAKNHTGGDVLDAIPIVVRDDSGDTSSSTLTINILDTAPLAIADVNAITEDTAPNPVSGNVITTGAGSDTLGADATAVTGIIAGAGLPGSNVTAGTTSANGTSVAGTYGTLVLGANGSYTYTLNNANPAVQAIARNQSVSDTFTYTITDADGDPSTTTLAVTVTGTNDAPDITVGAGDSSSASLAETNIGLTASGTLSIFDIDTQDTVTPSVTSVTASYSGSGVIPLTNAQLLAMLFVSGGEGSTSAQGAPNGIGWSFNSGSQAFNFLPNGQTLTLTYNIRATDSSGAANNTDNQPVTITITGTNDGVIANADTRTIAENATGAGRSGNVLTNDVLDPDIGQTTSVASFSIDHNGDGEPTDFAPGALVTITSASGGTLGVFTMASNGAYSFTPHQANFSGPVPVIGYTASSTGGDSASSTLSITVTPVSDAPGVTPDAATVTTNEDTAIALGFNAPTVTDSIDQTGAGAGDNPERLSLISLTGIPRGAILQDALGNTLYTIPASGSATVTVRLSDASNLIASPGAATLTMTTAQFEALRLLPPAHSGADITRVRMTVTEYEVDNAGNPLPGVAGAIRNADVRVDVLAVTDPIDLRIAGGNGPLDVTISEDATLSLTSALSPARLSAVFQDLDGSERRDIIIANPVGNGAIFVNGNAVAAGSSYTILWSAAGNTLETSQTGFPAINITTGANFSGDLSGITVTLRAQDTDTNAGHNPAILTDSVTLNLHVTPVAGDVTIAPVSTPEDTGVRFLNALTQTDTDGSETITGITINNVPIGWVIRDDSGVVVFTGNDATAYSVPAGEVTNGDFRNYTVTPAAHSSADRTLAIAVQTTDTQTVNGAPVTSTVTTNLSQLVAVTAVAERIGIDSNADATPDLTMNASFDYTTAGAEDQWFALSTDGFDFRTPWTNQDADSSERTFALVTPILSGGSAIGSQFRFNDGSGMQTVTYTGTPIQIPISALASVEFKAAPNVAGSFEIGVQALTIDSDPNGGTPVQAISGSATLTNLVIAPVADPVTLAVDAPAVGLEDTAIPLVIRATSADPSETFIVTLNGIPPGARIFYGGAELTVTAGSVSIANFSSATTLTLTPPLNSNVDIPLSVSAVSVDTSGALIDTSGATSLPLMIDVRGVADPVALTVQSPLQTSEALVDGGARRIALSGVITSVVPGDSDGSESVNLVISGVPAGFNIEGLTFMGGVGSGRLWSGTPAQVAAANLLVSDAHYSGTINFNVRAVSTENDGNSLSGSPVPVSIQVSPSPEAVLVSQTTVLEDTLTPVNFALQFPNVDGNETLHSVWVSAADLVGKPFTLYLGATPLADALVADGGWYKLTAAQAANVFAKGSANSDADGSFAIKYEIADPSSDGTLPATISQFDASHTLTVAALTDATVSTNDYSGGVVAATTTLEVKVSVTQQDDANAGGAKDVDGSERLLYFIIDNVPIGVTVEGGRYIGNTPGNPNTGRWILDTPDEAFNTATLDQTIRFALNGTTEQLSGLNQQVGITARTQDTGAVERTSTTTWTLQTAANFDASSGGSGGVPAATISQWVPDPLSVALTEDAPTPLAALVDAQIGGSSPFAVTITGLPAGSVVAGMMLTVIGGQNVWTAQGNGDNASLQALLAGISITPPPNWNANQGPFGFSTTLTTYDAGGTRNDASFSVSPSVTPVSDPIVLTASDADVLEDSTAGISLTLANPADGANSQVVGGKVYIRLDESAMESAGGSLSFAGSVVAPTAVSGIPGVPDGNYYVLTGVGSSANLALAYQAAANASGVVTYTAYVQGQETGAGNVTTTSVTGSFAVNPVNDGVALAVLPATGVEDQRIPLSIGATLNDAGEIISSLTLTNVPDGFLVFSGEGDPGTKAINLGSGVWGIPLVGGAIPAYIALQPPINWSGTLSNLQVGVWSGERDQDPVLTTTPIDVTVNGSADGISLTPTLSFGNEGQIVALNLNSVMPDSDGSETATLTFKGLGEHAAFYTGSSLLAATYDTGSDTYSLTGLTPAQITGLGVIQKDGVYNLDVTALTTDSPGSDSSALVTATLNLSITPVIATTGNDTLLYDGGPLNGLLGVDTIELRLGENLDFSLSPVKPTNIERFDLMPTGQNHSLNHLMLQDVLDMSGSGKTLTILGDSGDSVGLKDGSGLDKWANTGTEISGGHVFDIYTNSFDSAVKVLIEQQVIRHIDP